MIHDAIKEIEKHTCIRFVPYTNQASHIEIYAGAACFTTGVGMQKGEKLQVSLSSTSCMVPRIVIHELFHAIGLHHEQSRYDRDNYLTIRYENLLNNDSYSRWQLRPVNETESTFYDIPYNYASIMHYDAWSLGNGKVGAFVMEPKNLYYLSVMGYAQKANQTDWEKIRRIYDCKGNYPVSPPADIPCVDEDKWFDCNETYDYCDKDSTTIHNCRKTCGYCEWGKKPLSKPRPCKDWRTDCDRNKNECQTAWWMARKCPLTCGLCKAGTMEGIPGSTAPVEPAPPTKAPPQQNCEDQISYCNDYKDRCNHESWMKQACPKTCRFC